MNCFVFSILKLTFVALSEWFFSFDKNISVTFFWCVLDTFFLVCAHIWLHEEDKKKLDSFLLYRLSVRFVSFSDAWRKNILVEIDWKKWLCPIAGKMNQFDGKYGRRFRSNGFSSLNWSVLELIESVYREIITFRPTTWNGDVFFCIGNHIN